MGHMKTFGFLGFERWGGLRPAKMWTPDGRCFKPLFWRLWICSPRGDHIAPDEAIEARVNYILYWESKLTGTTGRGVGTLPYEVAVMWCEEMNELFPYFRHWIEPEEKIEVTQPCDAGEQP